MFIKVNDKLFMSVTSGMLVRFAQEDGELKAAIFSPSGHVFHLHDRPNSAEASQLREQIEERLVQPATAERWKTTDVSEGVSQVPVCADRS